MSRPAGSIDSLSSSSRIRLVCCLPSLPLSVALSSTPSVPPSPIHSPNFFPIHLDGVEPSPMAHGGAAHAPFHRRWKLWGSCCSHCAPPPRALAASLLPLLPFRWRARSGAAAADVLPVPRPLGGRRRRLVRHRAVRVGRHQEEGEGVVACL